MSRDLDQWSQDALAFKSIAPTDSLDRFADVSGPFWIFKFNLAITACLSEEGISHFGTDSTSATVDSNAR